MSMTPASKQYFAENASHWDELRAGYFNEALCEAAMQKAYLRPEMVVADIGCGTGFMATSLAPRLKKVFAFDFSQEMLAVAHKNLKDYANIEFHLADGLALPLPDDSLDVIFANMYLHHVPEPLEAIREMMRVLRPGGRLVITDLDAHPYEWLKNEMADFWQGFERGQILEWFEQAGLVNRFVACSGESCRAESASASLAEDERSAKISIFLAVATKLVPGTAQKVADTYGPIANSVNASSGCGSSQEPTNCCDSGQLISLDEVQALEPVEVSQSPFYSAQEFKVVPAEAAEISMGCGNPTALAGLQEGEVVLDIDSGGGLDAFLAARQVGPQGRVIGVDMTPGMLERARQTAAKAGYTQVEFRQGQANALPVEDESVDVILSNCVINLTADKGQVFQEAYRVLRPGGRLEVSDVLTSGAFLPERLLRAEGWGGCLDGALPEQEYLDLVSEAGFVDAKVHHRASPGEVDGVQVYGAQVSARKPVSGH